MSNLLPHIELETAPNPTATIIWLHGLGADGHDFESIVPQLGLPKGVAIRFIFPHAPTMPVSINDGFIMPSWYDLYATNTGDIDASQQDEQGIQKSTQAIEQFITREHGRGISADRIILVGFSQGGAMALHIGIHQASPLAGIIALSAYLPLHTNTPDSICHASLKTPIFMAHGTHDPVVLYEYGKRSAELLQQHGFSLTWHEYPMQHTVSPEESQHIGQWITATLFA